MVFTGLCVVSMIGVWFYFPEVCVKISKSRDNCDAHTLYRQRVLL